MKEMRRAIKPISIFLIISLVCISMPYGYASAAIIETEIAKDSIEGKQARNYILSVLAREKVQAVLTAQGIDSQEAKRRLDSLTDAEVIRFAKEIKQLPAGGGAVGTIVGAALIVFLVLLITDIMGFTDVFPFVKKHH
jgi:uncharacterized protein DUF6627